MVGLFGSAARGRMGIGSHRPVAALAVVALTAIGAAALAVNTRPAAAASGCRVSYTVTGSWRGGYTANVAIKNLGAPITHWTLAFTLPGDEAVTQNWSAVYSQSGRIVTAANAPYNARLRTDQSTDIGFNGAYSSGFSPSAPSSFTLNATPCAETVSTVSLPPAPADATPGPSVPLTAPTGGSNSSSVDGHLFESSGRYAQFPAGGYAISNDEWGSGYHTQTLWVNSATDWGLTATQPATPGVKSYANIGKNLDVTLNSLSSATSSFSESNPADGGNWESAYDLWLNGTGIEVMAWTYVSGAAQPLGRPVNTVTLDGNTWTLYVGDNGHNPTYSFVRDENETSGTVNLLGLLKYLENSGGYFSDPVLSSIQYGWEITSTGSGDVPEDFTMNGYSAETS